MNTADLSKIKKTLTEPPDGTDVLRLRTAVLVDNNDDGTADITLDGVSVERVPILQGTISTENGSIQVLSYRGALLILGGSGVAVPHTRVLFGTPSISNNNVTTLTPSSAPTDDGDMWPGSGTSLTVPSGQGGLYEAGIVLRYAAQATAAGDRQARINVNGTEYMVFQTPVSAAVNTLQVTAHGVLEFPLSAGDQVTFGAYQASGGALSLVGNSHGWLRRVR